MGGRTGFTTGTCAAGAAKAAAHRLLTGVVLNNVKVSLPGGGEADLRTMVTPEGLIGIRKDAGDDPDITNGAIICAEALFGIHVGQARAWDFPHVPNPLPRLSLTAGDGIGRVTKPGLSIPVGMAAINSVPVAMIRNEVAEVAKDNGAGMSIAISIAGGESLADRTFNPRLGIVGGLSILGTTGIVRPMSRTAYLSSLEPAIDVAFAAGHRRVFLVPGNIGEKAALGLGAVEGQVVQVSNFIGPMCAAAGRKDFAEIVLLGHLGKMLKVADGHLDTHSRNASLELGSIAEALRPAQHSLAIRIAESPSAERAIQLLRQAGSLAVLGPVADRARAVVLPLIGKGTRVEVVITDLQGEPVAVSSGGRGDWR